MSILNFFKRKSKNEKDAVVSSSNKYFNSLNENQKETNYDEKLSLSSKLRLKRSREEVTPQEEKLCNGSLQSKKYINDSGEKEELDKNVNEGPEEDKLYYLKNFQYILDDVFQYEDNVKLFNEEDRNIVQKFSSLSVAGQKLYVRLFQRKHKWLRANKMGYPEIVSDIKPIIQELCNNGLFIDSRNLDDANCALNLLSLAEVKILAKSFQVNIVKKGKLELISALLKHGEQNRSVCSFGSITNVLVKKAKQIIGTCYKLDATAREVFVRIMVLFSLTSIIENEDEGSGGLQQQLYTLLMINSGKLIFPNYEIIRNTTLFQDRENLIMYVNAKHLENDILQKFETKDFQIAFDFFSLANDKYKKYCSEGHKERDILLPSFLKRFTAGHVYTRCLSHGVDILQRLRKYKMAIELLEELLAQEVYCQDYRGHWWDRLALNLDQHLKLPVESMSAIQKGLADENVKCGHRLSWYNRGKRICLKSTKKYSFKITDIPAMEVKEAPKVVIEGRLFPRTLPGRKNLFISSSSSKSLVEGDMAVVPVEDLALEHYHSQGFVQGIHGEGATFISLFCLYFWKEIYLCKIPDVFHCPHQTYPLDLNSDHFYQSRQSEIDERLRQLENSSIDELVELGNECWAEHENEICLVQWERFNDWKQAEGLIRCLGNKTLVGICKRLAQNFRFCRSGVPDLVVWNPEELRVKFVEVKGPGDILSSKQVLWLDYLLSLEAEAEICYVKAISSKKLKLKETLS